MNFEDFNSTLIKIENVTKDDNDILNMLKLRFKIRNINPLLLIVVVISLFFNYMAITQFLEKLSIFGFYNADVIYLTYFVLFIILDIFVIFIFNFSIKKLELNKFNSSKINKLPRNYEFYKEYITVTTEKTYVKYNRTDFHHVNMNKDVIIFANKNIEVLEIIPIKCLSDNQKKDMIEYLEYTYAGKFYNYK